MNWSGTLTVRNTDDVAARLQRLLGGKTYTVRNGSGTQTGQQLCPPSRSPRAHPISATVALGAAVVEIHGTYGTVSFDTVQMDNGPDPEYKSAHLTFTRQGVTIKQRKRGQLHTIRITVTGRN